MEQGWMGPLGMDGCELVCLGVGDGWPSEGRNHSAYLYRAGGVGVLIDCGEPTCRVLETSGLGFDAMDAIVVSHLHFDHVGGLFMLLQGCWLKRRMRDLTVYLPPDGIEPIQALLRAGCLFPELLPFRLTLAPIRAGEPIVVGSVTVMPERTTHLEGFQRDYGAQYPQAYAAFSFVVRAGGLRLGHSADLGAVTDLRPLVDGGLDALICETAHLDSRELFEFLRAQTLGRVVFIHLTGDQWRRREAWLAEARRVLGELPCCLAEDGMVLSFP